MLCQVLVAAALTMACTGLHAQTTQENATAPDSELTELEKSPWLITPLLQSNPKLGASAGALGGYLHDFDKKSRPSIFGLQAQYSNTDSIIGGAFARSIVR